MRQRAKKAKSDLKPFTLAHFREWSSELVLDTQEKWILEPFQAAFLEDLFTGVPEAWLVVPEGNAKTTLAAGIALYFCQFKIAASVPVAAASRDQAEILYRQAEGFVYRSPAIEWQFKCLPGYRRINAVASPSRIQIYAADDATGDGVIPDLALAEELHRQRNLRLYRVWRGKIEKRGGQIVAISTSGEPGSEFEETREHIRQTGTITRQGCFLRAASPSLVLHEWAVSEKDDVEDLQIVKGANPLKAITIPMLRRKWESPTFNMGHWRRFVCNLPTRDENAAISELEWARAKTTEEIPAGVPIWIGLDLGWKYDTTALVPFWMRDERFRLFGPATVLVPDRTGISLDPRRVERALMEIHQRNPIHTVVLDPTHGGLELGVWIEEKIGAVVIARGQTNQFLSPDYELFMEGLRNGKLKHSGDQGLTAHALHAIARMLPNGSARFDRPSQTREGGDQDRRVIDALSAAAMVHSAAVSREPEAVFEVAFR